MPRTANPASSSASVIVKRRPGSSSTTRMRLLSSSMRPLLRGKVREGHEKARPLAGAGGHRDLPSVQFDDLPADREPEAGPLPVSLRGEERLEDPAEVLLRHPDPRVGHDEGQRG